MIYLWLIPLLLLLAAGVTLMFRNGTKHRAAASRLEEARSEDLHS